MTKFHPKPYSRYQILTLLFFTCLFFGNKMAIAQDLWTIPKISDEIIFDGKVDEPAWDQINPFPMVMHAPTFGNEPTERTEIMVGYTEDYLYLGARLFYSDISMLKSVGKLRDYLGGGTDWLRIFIDTFNDKENSLVFSTNPNGIRWDATVQFDAVPVEGGVPYDLSWNTFWEVKTTIDEKGWYAEMQIPFSSLRFQDQDGKVIMGMTVTRLMPSKNETITFPAIPPNWGTVSPWKPSQASEVVFDGISPSKPIYIAPYALAGYTMNNKFNDEETKYLHDEEPTIEAGLDLKFGLTTNLTMDVTVNTDFAQVEADDQMINLTRFTQFYPEKRIFFLERASIFDFNMGGYNNLFYSRRIGLHEGEPVRIYGGAKIIGRVGEWDLGFLDMQTAAIDSLPSENFGVLRIRRRVMNDYSYIGSMVTSRLGMDGSYNTAYGLDGIIRLFGDDYLLVKWAQTFETGLSNDPLSMSPARLLAIWQRRNEEGFAYDIAYVWSGEEFNPGIGFEMFENYSGVRPIFQYGWLPGEKSKLLNHKIAIEFAGFNRLPDKSFNSAYIIPGWSFFTKNTWSGTFALHWQLEDLENSIDFAGQADVPDGRYEFIKFKTKLHTPISKPIRTLIQMDAGTFYDGKKFTANLESIWDVSAGFELAGTYRFDWVDFNKRDQGFKNHIFGMKALYMINTKLSAKLFLQYNSAIDVMITNFRFRYNPKEGNDLYIVFNEGTNFYLDREIPAFPNKQTERYGEVYVYV